jgi:hypothetical protein
LVILDLLRPALSFGSGTGKWMAARRPGVSRVPRKAAPTAAHPEPGRDIKMADRQRTRADAKAALPATTARDPLLATYAHRVLAASVLAA